MYLGCTQRECKVNENVTDQDREMFESRISAAATEKLPGCGKRHANTVAWSCDMEGHAQKCVERYSEIGKQKEQTSYTKPQVLAWMISWRIVKSMLTYCLDMLVLGNEVVDLTFYGQ